MSRVFRLGLAVTIVALGGCEQAKDGLATAQVAGLEYVVTVARSFDLPDSDLQPYGRAEVAPLFAFEDLTAHSINGVDPRQVLVMRLEPEQTDNAGPLGRFILLVRGPGAFGAVCQYFDPSSDATPSECRPAWIHREARRVVWGGLRPV